MKTPRQWTRMAWLVGVWLRIGAGAAEPAVGDAVLTVRATSPRMGLLFTDSEAVDVRAAVSGAGAAVQIDYSVQETGGPWRGSGSATITPGPNGSGEAALALDLPGRGLYGVKLTARSGAQTASGQASVGVVFTPAAVDEASPWGIFYIPFTFAGRTPEQSMADIAENLRRLGASWVRFNFWAPTYGKISIGAGPNPQVRGDWSAAVKMVKALRQEGLLVMGEIAQCPRELSSRPDDTAVVGDAGSVYNRVKPKDYAQWDSFMENLARDFADDIPVWEIWNEANIPNQYWTGTVEELAELIRHSSRALKRGNPRARIAAAGFVGGHDVADRLFALGMGQDLDILSVHYTDINPGWTAAWKALLAKHTLNLPIWNTEELSEVPVRNLADGIERSFKFCHINIGYEPFRLLVNQDLTPREPAIRFAVGAHCLGTAKWLRHSSAPGCELDLFQRGEEIIAVVGQEARTAKLFATARSVVLAAEPAVPDVPITVTNEFGRTTALTLQDGKATLALAQDGFVTGSRRFINGARRLEVLSADVSRPTDVSVIEAETGRFGAGWSISDHDGFSEGRTVDIWSDAEPGPEGYWVEVRFTPPTAGRYELLFVGNRLSRLQSPASISTFTWQVDGGPESLATTAVALAGDVPGAPEGVSVLATLDLTAGEHVYRLKLSARREQPDRHYALWFDALALRPAR